MKNRKATNIKQLQKQKGMPYERKLQSVIYKCTVSPTNYGKYKHTLVSQKLIGNRDHKKSFKNNCYRNDTALLTYLWDLKEKHNKVQKHLRGRQSNMSQVIPMYQKYVFCV